MTIQGQTLEDKVNLKLQHLAGSLLDLKYPVKVTLTFETTVEGGGTRNDAYMDAISELKRQLEEADSTDDVIAVFNKVDIMPCS